MFTWREALGITALTDAPGFPVEVQKAPKSSLASSAAKKSIK
jgi:hypothetical protein